MFVRLDSRRFLPTRKFCRVGVVASLETGEQLCAALRCCQVNIFEGKQRKIMRRTSGNIVPLVWMSRSLIELP